MVSPPSLSPFPPLPLSIPPKFSDKPVGGKVRSSEGEVPRLPPTNTTLLPSLRRISRTWSKVMVILLSIDLVSNPLIIATMHALTRADRADGRQCRQPIICISAVVGGGNTSKKWTKVTDYYRLGAMDQDIIHRHCSWLTMAEHGVSVRRSRVYCHFPQIRPTRRHYNHCRKSTSL